MVICDCSIMGVHMMGCWEGVHIMGLWEGITGGAGRG